MSELPTVSLIDDIQVGERHRHDLGDVAALAASIDELGLLHPVVVTRDNVLVAGERRLAACRSLGWDEVPVTVAHNLADAADLLKAEADENTQRKAFTPTEAEAIASAIEVSLAPIREAERQAKIAAAVASQPRGAGGRVAKKPDGAKLAPSGPTPKTRDIAASATGFSAESIRKVREVKALAESPDTPEPVRTVAAEAIKEMDATGRNTPAEAAAALGVSIDDWIGHKAA